MAPPARDLSLDAALAAARDAAPDTGGERVPVARAAGRILAEDVAAAGPHPAFDNSAMDGVALRAAEAPGRLRLVGESRAGAPFDGTVPARGAVGISTGAAMPPGLDAVVPIERLTVDGEVAEVPAAAPGDHVRRRGEDLEAGAVVMRAGEVVAPHAVAALAGAGAATVPCRVAPRVALLVSGDELAPAGAPIDVGQVIDANTPGLVAQIAAAGAVVVAAETVPDRADATRAALARLLDGADVLITSGGVSVGEHDHLKDAFAAAGVSELFWGVRVRPGHPLWLGVRGDARVLGLPGNPVSAAVCFHVVGRVLLGHPIGWTRLAPLAAAHRSTTARAELVRCRFEGEALRPLTRQGSHDVTSLAGAEALAWIPEGRADLVAGTPVRWEPLG